MDYSTLNLGNATSLVTNIEVTNWGSEIVVSCLYDPLGSLKPYQLRFTDCREVHWQIIEPEEVKEAGADLIGYLAGVEAHQKAAVITTDIFEISILYGGFALQKNW